MLQKQLRIIVVKKVILLGLQDQIGLKGSEFVFQTRKENPVSSTRRVSGEPSISQSSVVYQLHKLGKSIWSCQNVPHI